MNYELQCKFENAFVIYGCTHDWSKHCIAVLELWKGGYSST
jgi:hypothetical protein